MTLRAESRCGRGEVQDDAPDGDDDMHAELEPTHGDEPRRGDFQRWLQPGAGTTRGLQPPVPKRSPGGA